MGLSTSCKYGIPTAWQQNNTNNNNTICPSPWHLCYRQATIRIIAERNGPQKTETRNSYLQSAEKRLWWDKGSQTHLHELLHCLGGKWIGTKQCVWISWWSRTEKREKTVHWLVFRGKEDKIKRQHANTHTKRFLGKTLLALVTWCKQMGVFPYLLEVSNFMMNAEPNWQMWGSKCKAGGLFGNFWQPPDRWVLTDGLRNCFLTLVFSCCCFLLCWLFIYQPRTDLLQKPRVHNSAELTQPWCCF